MYQKILVPVDGSAASRCGLREAIALAKSQGSDIHLIHIVNELVLDSFYSPGVYGSDIVESLRTAGRAVLSDAEALVRREGLEPQTTLLETLGGPAADLILQQAATWPADLIVMGTHGRRGLMRMAMGSDAEEVVRASPIPVLLVRGPRSSEAAAPSRAVAA